MKHLFSERKTLILTGPPFYSERDKELGELFRTYVGKKILCGGTTANIIARELGKKVTVQLKNLDPVLPPASEMEGATLVTEGIITLGKVAEMLIEDLVKAQKDSPELVKV